MSPAVSVVIPTCGRPQLLQRCLAALMQQSLAAGEYEIIVVDDGACAQTEALVRRLGSDPDSPALTYTQAQGTRGPAGARNRGWRLAHADVIAFTDDDTVPAHNWLAHGLRALQPDLAAVTGRITVPVSPHPTDFDLVTKGLEQAEFVTANAFVRREVLTLLGGFDERFTRAWREDSDLQFRMLRAGQSIGWAPDALVVHPVRPAPWAISLRQQRNMFFDALLYKKHPQLYCLKMRRMAPLRYYLIVLASVAAIVAWAQGSEAWAATFLGSALALSLHFAWQRLRRTSRAPRHVLEMVLTSLVIPYLAIFWRLAGAWRFRVLFW
jgi:GT2 family glycosyltransferase